MESPEEEEEETLDSELEDEIGEPTLDMRFRFIGQEFRDALEAVRETHEELSASASALDSLETIWSSSLAGIRPLSADDLKVLEPAFSNLPKEGLSARELVDRVFDAVIDVEWGPDFALAFIRRVYRTPRAPIFHNSMLINAVSTFETHMSRIAEEYYRCAPAALHDLPREAQKEFSLRELQTLGSVEEAIELSIERRVDQLMYGSFAGWKKFFINNLNIDFTAIATLWEEVREIYERRNCIVHNDSRASRRYAQSFQNIEIGEPLVADADYVEVSTERLELLGILLHIHAWSKFTENVQELIDSLESTAFEALKTRRWQFSQSLYEKWFQLPLSEAEQRMAKVNVWIAQKQINGLSSVQDDIETWDVSGSDEIYHFAKLCLLERLDSAFELLPLMIERDKVDGRSLATWPLLEPLRNDTRISEFSSTMRDYLHDENEISAASADDEEPARDAIALETSTSKGRTDGAGKPDSTAGGQPDTFII